MKSIRLSRLHFLVLVVLLSGNLFAQITVTNNQNATQMAQALVGKGVKITNATMKGVTNQQGFFTATPNAFPFSSGIVLTSGFAKANGTARGVHGANQATVVSNSLGTAGDATLAWLAGVGVAASDFHDANILEFDFVADGDSISFRYIFSSEEYNGFVCSQFNDVFGFVMTKYGPLPSPNNLAKIPDALGGASVPVTINSVNSGVPSGGYPLSTCQSVGLGSPYPAYFQSNAGGQYLTHFGRTKVLVARAKVVPCALYHLKICIGDRSDEAYDSGVFIEANSFISPPAVSLGLSNTYIDTNKDALVERCHPKGYVKVYRNKALDTTKALALNITYGGTATLGTDFTGPGSITLAPFQTLDSFPIVIKDDGLGDDNETIIVKLSTACSATIDSSTIVVRERWWYGSNQSSYTCYKNITTAIKSSYADSLNVNFLWSNGLTTGSIVPDSSGLYTCAATFYTSCYQVDTFKVTIDSLIVSVNPKNYSSCLPDSVQLIASVNQAGGGIIWSNGSTDTTIKVNASGNYIIKVTNAHGCTATDTSFVSYISPPVLQLQPNYSFCSGDSILLTASPNLGLHYTWSTGDTTNSIWAKTSGHITVIAQANGCIAYDTTDVLAKMVPVVNLPTGIQKCLGDSVLLNAATLPGSSYTWNSGSTDTSIWVKATGTYIVNVNANGCTATDTSVVIFYQTPVLNLVSAIGFCAGDSTTLNATTYTGTTYLWSTGETSPSITVKNSGTYSVKASLGVCDAYDTSVVTVTSYPVLNIPASVTSCINDSVLLDATNASGANYNWSTGAISPTIYINSSGTYIVTANINGCISKDTTVAVFNPTPVLNLAPATTFCAGDSAILNATTYAGTSYVWSTGETSATIVVKNNGTYSVKASLGVCDAYDTSVVTVTPYPILSLPASVTSCINDSVLLNATNVSGTNYTWSNGASSPTIYINSSGTYIVTANINGCISKDTTIAVFNPTPVLNLAPATTFCAGDSAILNATTYPGTSYAWSTGETSSSIIAKNNGTYWVKATLGVCSATDTSVISVTPYPVLSLPATITSCIGDSVLLDASGALATGYSWNNAATTPTIYIKNSGTYIVTANNNGCARKDTTTATFYPKPAITLIDSVGFCADKTYTLKAVSNIPLSLFSWSNGSVADSVIVNQTGQYSVTVSANGCKSVDSTWVTVYPLPTVNAGTDVYVMKSDSVTINATASSNIATYLWTPAYHLSNPAILTPVVKQPKDTTYKIIVTTAYGCRSEDFMKVITLAEFVIPNAFSPNGDSKNDVWEIKGLENYVGATVRVFDRYGTLVFSRYGYTKPWDGTYRNTGKPLAVATYYYIIDLKRGDAPLTGSVTILR